LATVGYSATTDERLSDVARRALERFAEAHGKVCLKVGAVRTAHERVHGGVLGSKGARDGTLEALSQLLQR
jgi:hypothetical protein